MAETNEAARLRWLIGGGSEQRRAALRYWLRDPAMGALNVGLHVGLRYTSIDACSALGAVMGQLAQLRMPDKDKHAREVWRRLRPQEADPALIDSTMKRLWRHIGRTLAEFSVLDRLWPSGRVEVEGLEHLAAARAAGKRIIFLAVHLGNWEVIGSILIAHGYFGAGVYEVPENRFEHWIVRNFRKRYGAKLVPQGSAGARAAVNTLLEMEVMLIFIDEVIGGRVNAPAFGCPMPDGGNIVFAARLAAMTDAVVIPAYCLRRNDRAQFKVNFLPPMQYVNTGRRKADLAANVAMTNALVEGLIQPNLDQWYYTNAVEVGV
jgi:Kdo2-lipid IVA lauroyltransferase/acyltransferase